MKKKIICLVLIVILCLQSAILSSCLAPNDVRIDKEQIIESLKNDYGINIEKEYGSSNLYSNMKKDYPNLLYYEEVEEKLSKWTNNLSILYIKTDKGEDKFVYHPRSIAKKSIKVNGEKVYAEIKDYIYITDFPFTYTYDEIYEQCEEIVDVNIKDELLAALENSSIRYETIYPNKKSMFDNFTNEEAILINSLLIDKHLVLTCYFKYTTKYYYYSFFYIQESSENKLYIYKEATMDSTDSKVIYPSSMTKDAFINHLKTL